MDVVIRDAKTIEEFKTRRADMEQRAVHYYETHRAACEDWQDGAPSRALYSWTEVLLSSTSPGGGGTTGTRMTERNGGNARLKARCTAWLFMLYYFGYHP